MGVHTGWVVGEATGERATRQPIANSQARAKGKSYAWNQPTRDVRDPHPQRGGDDDEEAESDTQPAGRTA